MFWQAVMPSYGGRLGLSHWKYVESCLRMFDVYRQLVDGALGGFDRLGPVLDFGSGYGRLTRSLVQRLPRERIWVSDLYGHAIAWQAETLGVNALLSVTAPQRLALAQRHSLVFAGSVFSHLPDRLFRGWLERLYRLVADDGVLAFSVHDARLLPEGVQMDAQGIGYLHASESLSHSTEIYGGTYVTRAYVEGAVASACGVDAARIRCFPLGLYEKQDLYLVPGASVDLSGFELRITPIGGFQGAVRRPDGSLHAEGWGVELNPGHRLERADVFDGERRVASVEPVHDDPQLLRYFPGAPIPGARWSFDLPAADSRADLRVDLRVELASSAGPVAFAYVSGGDPGETT
jgi:SAM-dependent methyltransferase